MVAIRCTIKIPRGKFLAEALASPVGRYVAEYRLIPFKKRKLLNWLRWCQAKV